MAMKTSERLKKIKPADLQLAKKFAAAVRKQLGNEVVAVFVYGSRARGQAKDDSDLDLLVLTKHRPNYGGEADNAVIDVATDLWEKSGILISAIPYGLTDYRRWKNSTPVLYWIDREGVKI